MAASVNFDTLKDCLKFLEWLKSDSNMQGLVAHRLNKLLQKRYHTVNQPQIEQELSKFLTHVSNFYKNLCKSHQGSYAGQKTAKNVTNALLNCVPKLLSAMYFLRYKVDKGFEALGGGGWANEEVGVIAWYAGIGQSPSMYMKFASNIEKYLIANNGYKQYGVIPGGFAVGELQQNGRGKYSVGSHMAKDLTNICEKHAGENRQNYFLDVYSTTVLPTSGSETPNIANALRLVQDFCKIFGTVNEQDFHNHLYMKDRCFDLPQLQELCKQLISPLNKLFSGQSFSFTGYAREYDKLKKQDIAKKMASWFKTHLHTVRSKLMSIQPFSSKKVNFRDKKLRSSTALPQGYHPELEKYFTTHFFPHGFTFYSHRYDTKTTPYEQLFKNWSDVINELKRNDAGLDRLVSILNGEKCQQVTQDADDEEAKDEPPDEMLVDGKIVTVTEEPEIPEEVLPEKKPVPTKTEAAKPVVTKAEAAKPSQTDATPDQGKKAEGAQNQGKKAEGAQNQGKKAEGAQNQGKKVEGAQNQGKKSEGAQNQGKKAESDQNSGQNKNRFTGPKASKSEQSSSAPTLGTGSSDAPGPGGGGAQNQPQEKRDPCHGGTMMTLGIPGGTYCVVNYDYNEQKTHSKKSNDFNLRQQKKYNDMKNILEEGKKRVKEKKEQLLKRQETHDQYHRTLLQQIDVETNILNKGPSRPTYPHAARVEAEFRKRNAKDDRLAFSALKYPDNIRIGEATGHATADSRGIPKFAAPQGRTAIGVSVGYPIKRPKTQIKAPPAPTVPEFTVAAVPDRKWVPSPPLMGEPLIPLPQSTYAYPATPTAQSHASTPRVHVEGGAIEIPMADLQTDFNSYTSGLPEITGQPLLDIESKDPHSSASPIYKPSDPPLRDTERHDTTNTQYDHTLRDMFLGGSEVIPNTIPTDTISADDRILGTYVLEPSGQPIIDSLQEKEEIFRRFQREKANRDFQDYRNRNTQTLADEQDIHAKFLEHVKKDDDQEKEIQKMLQNVNEEIVVPQSKSDGIDVAAVTLNSLQAGHMGLPIIDSGPTMKFRQDGYVSTTPRAIQPDDYLKDKMALEAETKNFVNGDIQISVKQPSGTELRDSRNHFDIQIDVPKRPLQDSSYDIDLDDPYANTADTLRDELKPSDDKGFSGLPNTNFDLHFGPERAGLTDYEDPGMPRDPARKTDERVINPFSTDECHNPWSIDTSTIDIITPPTSALPDSDRLPPPRTVREMLCWLVGLNQLGYIGFITDYIYSILKDANKNVSKLSDAIDVTGDPQQLTASHVAAKLTETCLYSASVLYKITHRDDYSAYKEFMFESVYSQFRYSTDPACLLCQLQDYVYACHHQLQFLKAQCNRGESLGGWQDCKYGSDTKTPSPLQAFLTDSWDSTFETHLFDPRNLCLKSRVRMGFRKGDLPKTLQQGSTISAILNPTCGGDDPLLTLCSYLNCLTRRTPRTTGELVSFFHNFGVELHGYVSGLSSLGESLSKPHPDCPDWDRLGDTDLDTVRGIRGSETLNVISKHNSSHDKEHPRTLSTLVGCSDDSSHCHRHLSPITYRAYALYSQAFAHTYLSWAVYLPDRLWESLLKLYYDLLKHSASGKCTSLHLCSTALPLLYLHGFTPPEVGSQVSLKCSDVIAKLEEIVNGQPIASLMTAMDNFLYGIREPFILTLVALWSLAFLIFANTMLYRLDILHIRSHLIRSKASHLIDVKALLSDSKKMMSLYDANYFDDDPNELLNLRY